jgi:hypothetical protein
MLRVPFIDVIGSVSQENVSQFLSLGLERKKLNKKKLYIIMQLGQATIRVFSS